ncbi:MAG: ribonuclease E/G, partial [Solirubrobacteraceae bacterium]
TNRNDLYELLKSEMATDKAKHKILPPSKFGLIQITRQRVRPETVYDTYEENPNGGQKIQAPILIIKNIEYELKSLTETKNNKVLNIHAHPFLIAFLKSGFLSQRIKWMIDYKVILKLTARDSFKYLAYQIKDNKAKLLSKHSN